MMLAVRGNTPDIGDRRGEGEERGWGGGGIRGRHTAFGFSLWIKFAVLTGHEHKIISFGLA